MFSSGSNFSNIYCCGFPVSLSHLGGSGLLFCYFNVLFFLPLFLVASRDRLVWLVGRERDIRDSQGQ